MIDTGCTYTNWVLGGRTREGLGPIDFLYLCVYVWFVVIVQAVLGVQ